MASLCEPPARAQRQSSVRLSRRVAKHACHNSGDHERAEWQFARSGNTMAEAVRAAVARPTAVTWSMGDGGSVTCDGPGTAFPAGGDPKSASPDCGHTYRTSSAGQQVDAFPVKTMVNRSVRPD